MWKQLWVFLETELHFPDLNNNWFSVRIDEVLDELVLPLASDFTPVLLWTEPFPWLQLMAWSKKNEWVCKTWAAGCSVGKWQDFGADASLSVRRTVWVASSRPAGWTAAIRRVPSPPAASRRSRTRCAPSRSVQTWAGRKCCPWRSSTLAGGRPSRRHSRTRPAATAAASTWASSNALERLTSHRLPSRNRML